MNNSSNSINRDAKGKVNCPLKREDSEVNKCMELEDEYIKSDKQSIWKWIRENSVLRLRIVHTVLIAWACFAIGWRLAMLGPTFPDLLQIIDVDVSMGSWLLTAFYIGNVAGSLTAGCLYDRFSKLLVTISCMIMLSLSSAIIPWCTSFTLMIVAHVLSGASYGAADVVTITDVLHVWSSQSAPVLQLTQFMYGLGAIISPLAATPFLSKRTNGHEEMVLAMGNITNRTNEHMIKPYQTELAENITQTPGTDSGRITESTSGNVYIAFSIAALLSVVNAVAFISYFVISKDVYIKFNRVTKCCKSQSRQNDLQTFSKRTKFYFVCALAMLLMLHLLVERNFVSYFTSYVTKKAGWSKTRGSTGTSVYFIASATGRLIASPILTRLSLTKAMFMYLMLATLALIGIFCTTFADTNTILWLCVVILGFSFGPLFTAWFSWLSENVVIASGKITGTMYIIGVTACCFFPPLIGYLMVTYTYDWLVYILLILGSVMMLMFLLVVYIHRRLINS